MVTLLKKSLIVAYLFTPFMNALDTTTPPLTITLTNQVNFEFVRHCCTQAAELKEILIQLLHELSEDMNYWNLQQLTTFSYFISKGPTGWFADKTQEQELYEKIVFLKKALEKNAYYLGRIHSYLIKNYQEESAQEIEQHMREVLLLIHNCVSPEHAQPYDIVLQDQEVSQQQWSQLLVSNEKNLSTFYYRMSDAYYGYKKPNHFRRNWFAYSIAAASATALAVYAFRNQKNIKESYAKTLTALNYYYKSHMYEPIADSVTIMTDETTLIGMHPIDEETVRIEQEALNNALRIYCQRQNEEAEKPWYQKPFMWFIDWLYPHSKVAEKMTPEQIEQVIQEANNGHIPKIIGDRTKLLGNPVIGFFRRLPSTLAIELYHAKTQGTKLAKNGVDNYNLIIKMISSMRLIVALSALMPTFLIGKLLYTASKDTLHYINKKNILPLKNCTRLIHRTLNKYTNADEIPPTDLGFMVFWIEELKKQIKNLPQHDQCAFREDLDDLLNNILSIKQKKAVIHRMYGTYNFLTPGA